MTGRLKEELLRAEADPRSVAAGFALGVFVGMTPLFGLHTLIVLAVALLFRWSKAAALVGSYLNTPYTVPFTLYASLHAGALLLGRDVPSVPFGSLRPDLSVLDALRPFVVPLLAGSVVLGAVAAVPAYLVVLFIARRLKPREGEGPGAPAHRSGTSN